jgi:phosphatidylglycerophosphate synthase
VGERRHDPEEPPGIIGPVLDTLLRRALAPGLDAAATRLDRAGLGPDQVTAAGFAVGAGACVAAGFGLWGLAGGLFLANRALDGLDGSLARRRGATDRGGFLDIVTDFAVYGGFVLGVAVAEPDARLACAALLLSYYLSGTAFLAWSSLAERRAIATREERSLRFVGGLAEGTETTIAYLLFCLFPGAAATIAWVFAGVVGVTALQRVTFATRSLRPAAAAPQAAAAPRSERGR